MTPYIKDSLITEDGIYTLAASQVGSDYILYVSGNFGGGSVTFGYIDGSEAFASFRDSNKDALTSDESSAYFVIAPPSRLLAVKVEGATSPEIKLQLTRPVRS
jgi:hypothetical protein